MSREAWCCSTALLIASLLVPPAASASSPFDEIAELQPVVLRGGQVADLLGIGIGEIWAYRYDAVSRSFAQVPIQIDERLQYDLTRGQTFPVYELTYDWWGSGNGLLDADDEIAFMARDSGDRAPDTDAWVSGSRPLRIEVRIFDPLSGAVRWLYLYSSATITDQLPGFAYVDYSAPDPISGIADVETPAYSIGYQGRWRLTRLRVKPGPDLLDRIKVRAFALVGSQTEETYEQTSELLGARRGKVRALRETQGAASGMLTTHLDTFYRDTWVRTIHLRVHAMPDIWYYYDYLPPPSPGRFFSSTLPSGLPIDGSPEVPSTSALPTWSQASLPGGTLVLVHREMTPFPFPAPTHPCAPQAGAFFHWRDSTTFNDTTGDDPFAYGNHGQHLRCTADTNASPYSAATGHYFLPPQNPHSAVGGRYEAAEQSPLQATVQSQQRSALTDARLDAIILRPGGRLDFSWTDALGEDAYEIYRGGLLSPFAYSHNAPLACNLPAQSVSWTTPDDQVTGQPDAYYLVVPRRDAQREYGRDSGGAPRPPSSAPCP